MSTLREQYAELAALCQLYLFQEFHNGDRIPSNIDVYHFFRHEAQVRGIRSYNIRRHTPSRSSPSSVAVMPTPPSVQITSETNSENTPPPATEPSPSQQDKNNKASEKPPPFNKTRLFKLSKPKSLSQDNFEDIKAMIQKLGPKRKILDNIPDDAEALRIKEAWRKGGEVPSVMIIDSEAQYQTFLHHIAKAVALQGFSAKVIAATEIERYGCWKKLFNHPEVALIVISEDSMKEIPDLSDLWNQSKQTLGTKPVLLLSDIATYFSQPRLKATLWSQLCQRLQAIKT